MLIEDLPIDAHDALQDEIREAHSRADFEPCDHCFVDEQGRLRYACRPCTQRHVDLDD